MAHKNATVVLLLLISTSLWATDRDISIDSATVGASKPWQWTIFLRASPDVLDHIKCVQYTLDPTFPNPSRTVCSRGVEDKPFPSSGTTWGPFKLSATVAFDDGNMQQLRYELNPQNVPKTQQNTDLYQSKGWHPIDMTSNFGSGLFVLDDNGRISSVITDGKGLHVKTLSFNIPRSSRPIVLAASKDSLFVSANNSLGCTVFRYSFSSKRTTQKLLESASIGQGGCDGIATDGTGLFLIVPGRREIRYWTDFDSPTYKSWTSPAPALDSASGVLNFNETCHCLIFASLSGTAYSLSLTLNTWSTVTSNLGYVHSVTSDSSRMLFASGKTVLFYSMANNRRDSAPPAIQSLAGGLISGVTIDSTGSLWISDYDQGIIKGPIPLN